MSLYNSIICLRLTFSEIPHNSLGGVLIGAFGCPKRYSDALLAKTMMCSVSFALIALYFEA